MLGNLTESNMLQYLGIIEQKTTEVLQAYAATQLSMSSNANTAGNEQASKELHLTVVQQKGPVFDDIMREYDDMMKEGGALPGAVSEAGSAAGGATGVGSVTEEFRGLALTSTTAMDSGSEDDERPLTRQELDKKTMKEFARKTKQQQQQQ